MRYTARPTVQLSRTKPHVDLFSSIHRFVEQSCHQSRPLGRGSSAKSLLLRRRVLARPVAFFARYGTDPPVRSLALRVSWIWWKLRSDALATSSAPGQTKGKESQPPENRSRVRLHLANQSPQRCRRSGSLAYQAEMIWPVRADRGTTSSILGSILPSKSRAFVRYSSCAIVARAVRGELPEAGVCRAWYML